jgi:16S rRNA processing protein RimM
MNYFEIGTIVNTQGIKGEVRILPTTDNPKRFELLENIEVFNKSKSTVYKIESLRYHKQFIVMKLEGIDNMNDAEKLKTYVIKITEDKVMPLDDGEFYIRDLYGINVITLDGENLGTLTDIITAGGANDVYIVSNDSSKDLLIPAIKQCILNVDIVQKIMTVHLLPGLR